MAVAQFIAIHAFAEQREAEPKPTNDPLTMSLPKIGNTSELDRTLSREVSDTFVFGQNEQSQTNSVNNRPVSTPTETVSTDSDSPSIKSRSMSVSPTLDTDISDNRATNSEAMPAESISAPAADTWSPVFNRDTGRTDTVWQHIIDSNRLPLTNHERVRFYIDQYQRESLWISKIMQRSKPFLAHMVATLDQRFLPVELALLPAIESGYKPTAMSDGNASGLWQIVPITAKEIGVLRNEWFDGRGDVLTSTTAAIDYLSYLNAEFDGDWELTLAAYNAGPGRIRAAMRKNEKKGLPTDYWSLALPEETRNYVPKLTALVRMIKSDNHGGLDLPTLTMEPAFELIDIGFRVSVDRAAEIADIDLDLLHSLNAGLIHGVTAPQGPHHLLIPIGTGDKIQRAFNAIDRKAAFTVPSTHNVASGDTISSIALKYGLTQRDLLIMNGLDDTKIRIGQKLAIMDKSPLSKSIVKYVVAIGDTLSEIAHKFSVNVQDITLSTGEVPSNDVIHPGDTLNITVGSPTSG